MRLASGLAVALAGYTALAGCTTVTRLGSHDAAPRMDDALASVACGGTTCAAGTVCCNASCGICVAPGATCIDILCTDAGSASCGGDEALLEGTCTTTLHRWTGSTCEPVVGCTCSGRDCGRLRSSAPLCWEEHGECWSHACLTDGGLACPEGFFCETPTCTATIGSCVRLPEACDGGPQPVVCGCDGLAFEGACEARRSAVSHDDSVTCGICDANLAVVTGGCTMTLGYVWDGGRCAGVRGCGCTDECDRLYASLADCTTARAPCLTFACDAIECRRWDEVCVRPTTGARCDPVPGSCEGVPSCACIGAAAECTETGPGAFVVTPRP